MTGRSYLLSELAAQVGGELEGDASLRMTGVQGLAQAGPSELAFYGSARYRAQLESTRAGAVLVTPDAPRSSNAAYVRVVHPHLAFARIAALFHPPVRYAAGIDARALVHPEAKVHPEAAVMAGAVIERGAQVGARSALLPGSFLGEGAVVGEDCVLHPHATVLAWCLIGSRVTLHASCVIGADGFGFAFDPEAPQHVKIPQAGIVRIEDDVEIGACSCIDRATLGETVIGRGTKIDNLVQVAHNVKVGPMSLLCAQAGVAGSAELGAGVVLAGQVGVVGHIKVGDHVKVGAQSGVGRSLPSGAEVSGSPVLPHREWLKAVAAFEKLPGLVKEVRRLRREVDRLSGGKAR